MTAAPPLEQRYVLSKSGADPYLMVRENGRWTHADTRCTAFAHGKACHHIKQCEESDMGSVPDERAVTMAGPLDMVERVDIDQIVRDLLPDPGLKANGQHPWVYSFKSGGQQVVGVSSDGVDDAMRALAFKGETIRVLYVRLDREDPAPDGYAYFMASAARFAISPAGQEICLDSTVRGKRVWKYQMAYGKQIPDDSWYEKGVTKAARNVCEALLPEALKMEMIRRAQGQPSAKSSPPPTALRGPAREPAGERERQEEPIDAAFKEQPSESAPGATVEDPIYNVARSDTARYFAQLSAFQRELGQLGVRQVPDKMHGWTLSEIIRALSGAE